MRVNKNKLLVLGKNMGLCLYMTAKKFRFALNFQILLIVCAGGTFKDDYVASTFDSFQDR